MRLRGNSSSFYGYPLQDGRCLKSVLGSLRSGILLFILCLMMVFLSPDRGDSAGKEIWCTSPWISMITEFIGGIHVSVHSIENWDEMGTREIAIPVNDIPSGVPVIALDMKEAVKVGIYPENSVFMIKPLYVRIPVREENLGGLFYDPSTLPFIAQRIMNILSGFDPGNYSYYQRRLAEFQTRLDSTVLVGRQLLAGTHILLYGNDVSQLFVAAGCSIDRMSPEILPPEPPDDSVRNRKERKEKEKEFEEGMARLLDFLRGQKSKGIIPVFEGWLPSYISEVLVSEKAAVLLPRPSVEHEFILFLNDHYLTLWNELRLLHN